MFEVLITGAFVIVGTLGIIAFLLGYKYNR